MIPGGRLVAILADGILDSGLDYRQWGGHSNRGDNMASGPYIARLVSATGVMTTMILLSRWHHRREFHLATNGLANPGMMNPFETGAHFTSITLTVCVVLPANSTRPK